MKRLFHLLLLILLTGCNTIEVKKQLQDIESYIAARPDSALSVIESMDSTALKTRGLKAHHALLHAMALDKNYIDVTDDSLALTAVNWYRNHGPKKNLARSMYYLALSYFYDRQYDRSIVKLAETEPIAEKYDSLYWGFVKVLQADIHDINYNNLDEIKSLEEALNIYTHLKADYYINVAKLRLSQAYISDDRYDEAEILLDELMQSERLNERMKAKTIRVYAFLNGTRDNADYDVSVNYYEKAVKFSNGRYMSRLDYWVWAHALAETGNMRKAQEIISLLSPIDTSGNAYYWQYEIAKIQGKTSEALCLFEKFSDKNNDEVVNLLKRSISAVQRDFYHSQYEMVDYKARNRGLIILVVTISSIFILTLIIIHYFRYRRNKEEEREQYIRYAEELGRQLSDFKNDYYSSLQKKYISLYKTKYEIISTLHDKYVRSEGRADAESMIYRQVVSLINDLRDEIENTKKFERTLDDDLNGIMTHLRKEFPDLKQKDYTLFGYLALGFDSLMISHFMNCTTNSVYIIKSRLKKSIENSSAEHKTDFLEIID